jgi:sterol desaturase/sphingolipid hydroxylase (fatty acid hydroxylase superfamily)
MGAIIWFVISMLTADLIGYWLHRWAHRPRSPLHRPHMTHHVRNYPPRSFLSRKYQASGSDSLALWFVPFGIVYVVLVIVLGLPHPVAIIAGGALTAVLSSVVHDLSHVEESLVWRVGPLRWLGRWHRIHHSKMGRNFGILLTLWDRLFGTIYRGTGAR